MRTNKFKFLLRTFVISSAIGIVPIGVLSSCSNSGSLDSSKIKITFDAGEGKIISGTSSIDLPKDTKITFGSITKPTVSATNKLFAGWSVLNDQGKEIAITDSEIISKSLTVKANYVTNTSGLYWTITFDTITGSYITGNNIVAVKNKLPFFTINKPIATKENAVFRYWSTTPGGDEFVETTNITQNYTLYPVFADIITITYGTLTNPPTGFAYSGPTTVPALSGEPFATIGRPNPTAPGYHFDGWYYDDVTFAQPVNDTDTFNTNTTIYPKMTPNA